MVDYEAPNWKLRRQIYDGSTLIDTQWPGTPRGFYRCQQLMVTEAAVDITSLGFDLTPASGVALSGTALNLYKASTGKRRQYDVLPV